MEKISRYKGKKIDIIYDRSLCIHVGECGRGSKDLFDASKDPWCDPDAVSLEEAIDIVERCPTGSLRYERTDGGAEEALTANEVVVSQDGPVYLRGDLRVQTSEGEQSLKRIALCRCGASKNKPFCDRAHVKADFHDSGAVGQKGDPIDEASGPLEVNPLPNGPVLLNGKFRVLASTGRVAFTGTKAALCRCGSSKNKPFCDGAHNQAGFSSE